MDTKYFFNNKSITKWYNDVREPLKIKGNVNDIIRDLKNNDIQGVEVKELLDGNGWVIPESQTLEDRDLLYFTTKERNILLSINTVIGEVENFEKQLLKSIFNHDYERIQKEVSKRRSFISNKLMELSKETKSMFIDDIPSSIIPSSNKEYFINKIVEAEKTKEKMEEINFPKLLVDGYFNDSNRTYLDKYFLREFKKAEKEHFYEVEPFFDRCMKVIELWEDDIKRQIFERKKELYQLIELSSSNEDKERFRKEVKDLRSDGVGNETFLVQLNRLHRIGGHISYDGLLLIKQAIREAAKRAKSLDEVISSNDIVPVEETKKKYTAREYALAYILDLHVAGNQLPVNRVEGSLSAKEIKRIGEEKAYDIKPDTFYRAVKDISRQFDLNNKKDLDSISCDWRNAVRELSINWGELSKYLEKKSLHK